MADFTSLGPDRTPRMRKRLMLLMVLLWLVTLTGLAGRWHWLADLTNHFRLQYVGAAFGLLLLACLLRDRRLVLFGIVVGWTTLVLLVWPLRAQWLAPQFGSVTLGPQLSVVTVNLLTGNPELEPVLDWLRATRPDVLVVQELDDRAAAALDRVDPRLHRIWAHTEDGAFGLGVWSRLPAGVPEPRDLGPYGLASVRIPILLDGVVLQLLATHPFPPIGGEGSAARNQQFTELADWLHRLPGPALLVGDLNATPWSAPLQDLARVARLSDGSHRRWPIATWRPKRLGLLAAPLALPIDHVLVRGGAVVALARGPEFGSDHRPLWAQVRITQRATESARVDGVARIAATTAASKAPGPDRRH